MKTLYFCSFQQQQQQKKSLFLLLFSIPNRWLIIQSIYYKTKLVALENKNETQFLLLLLLNYIVDVDDDIFRPFSAPAPTLSTSSSSSSIRVNDDDDVVVVVCLNEKKPNTHTHKIIIGNPSILELKKKKNERWNEKRRRHSFFSLSILATFNVVFDGYNWFWLLSGIRFFL